MEHRVINIIKSFNVYLHNRQDGIKPQLKPCVVETFKAIYNSTNKEEQKIGSIHNININEKHLKTYLSKRYSRGGNNKLANKLCCLFSWTAGGSTKLDYKAFYDQLDQVILNSGIATSPHIQDF